MKTENRTDVLKSRLTPCAILANRQGNREKWAGSSTPATPGTGGAPSGQEAEREDMTAGTLHKAIIQV